MTLWPSGDNPIYKHTKSKFPVLRIKNMVNNSRPAHAAQRASAPTKRPVNKYATIVYKPPWGTNIYNGMYVYK